MEEQQKPILFEIVNRDQFEPVYANLVGISHSNYEFIFEFAYFDLPTAQNLTLKEGEKIPVKMKSKVIMPAMAINEFLKGLDANFKAFLMGNSEILRRETQAMNQAMEKAKKGRDNGPQKSDK